MSETPSLPQRYAAVSNDGDLQGFYSSDINRRIPPNAVAITEQQYQQWLSGQGSRPVQRYRLVAGQLVATEIAPPLLTADV